MKSDTRYRWILLACALAAVALVFANGVGTGYVFDDYSSVFPMRELREHPEYFWQLVAADGSGPLGRPISMLTFAIEQAWLHAEPAFSQGVSIALHIVNTLLVFALLNAVLSSATGESRFLIAVFGAMLWAFTPQKVSAVLYIVQRMAMLSAFFMLVAMLAYIQARRAASGRRRLAFVGLTVVAVIAAPFAKENGVLAIPLIAAIEVYAFAGLATSVGTRHYRSLATAVLILGAAGFVALGFYEYDRSAYTYAQRNFDFLDRVASAPDIVLGYARQFFFPRISSLGLMYDDYRPVSLGESPLRLLLPTLALLGALLYLVRSYRRGEADLVALGIAVFLIGHSIESSYLPLELIFEHRNYLPSLGLVIILSALLVHLLTAKAERWRHTVFFTCATYAAVIMFASTALTASWRSYEALSLHHLSGHPRSSRASADFGLVSAARGDYQSAVAYIQRGYDLSRSEPAAKTISLADVAVLNAASACLAEGTFGAVFPDPSVVTTPDAIHGVSLRVLRRIYQDEVCPEADWAELSAWLETLVAEVAAAGHEMDYFALQDLVALERYLGNALRTYVYAAMAVDRNPDDASMLLSMLDAAIFMRDDRAVGSAMEQIRRLQRAGALSGREKILLQSLEAETGR